MHHLSFPTSQCNVQISYYDNAHHSLSTSNSVNAVLIEMVNRYKLEYKGLSAVNYSSTVTFSFFSVDHHCRGMYLELWVIP